MIGLGLGYGLGLGPHNPGSGGGGGSTFVRLSTLSAGVSETGTGPYNYIETDTGNFENAVLSNFKWQASTVASCIVKVTNTGSASFLFACDSDNTTPRNIFDTGFLALECQGGSNMTATIPGSGGGNNPTPGTATGELLRISNDGADNYTCDISSNSGVSWTTLASINLGASDRYPKIGFHGPSSTLTFVSQTGMVPIMGPSPGVTITPQFGTNLGKLGDYVLLTPFTDVRQTARAFSDSPFSYTNCTLDTDGWPTAAHYLTLPKIFDTSAGVYPIQCTGDISLCTFYSDAGWTKSITYNSGTNTSSGTLTAPTDATGQPTLDFTLAKRTNASAPGTGYTNLEIKRPGLPFSSSIQFMPDFTGYSVGSRFVVARFMTTTDNSRQFTLQVNDVDSGMVFNADAGQNVNQNSTTISMTCRAGINFLQVSRYMNGFIGDLVRLLSFTVA